ncbi:hypothetical protein HAX54_050887 [Datura stramonium]|uniref:Uncharacterized protein n=1 Tax=Datura stramonium TaxID=4076 RepID=A0ABS8WQQ1_DATST|nr:hypothetical protein [Datura stramonium]
MLHNSNQRPVVFHNGSLIKSLYWASHKPITPPTDQSDGPLYLTTDRCIGSWEVTKGQLSAGHSTTTQNRYNDVTSKQEATGSCCKKKIAKRRQLHDKAKYKAQEAATATTSPPQSDEGGDEAESDGDNPLADNAGKGNDDDAQLGEGDTNAEESSDKYSGAEESND